MSFAAISGMRAPMVDLVIEDSRWDEFDVGAMAARAVAATLSHLGIDPMAAEVALLACDDARIATLNSDFRGKPAPTNVLSWPAEDLGPFVAGEDPQLPKPDPDGVLTLGDIAIAWDTCAREAQEQGKTMRDHATHLIVHAMLHLLGYDHIRDPDAEKMEALEVEILGSMGVADPY